MEFHVQLTDRLPDSDQLNTLLTAEDPAAMGDLDCAANAWRVNTALSARDLVSLLGKVGCPTPLSKVTQLPSVCCGGCG